MKLEERDNVFYLDYNNHLSRLVGTVNLLKRGRFIIGWGFDTIDPEPIRLMRNSDRQAFVIENGDRITITDNELDEYGIRGNMPLPPGRLFRRPRSIIEKF